MADEQVTMDGEGFYTVPAWNDRLGRYELRLSWGEHPLTLFDQDQAVKYATAMLTMCAAIEYQAAVMNQLVDMMGADVVAGWGNQGLIATVEEMIRVGRTMDAQRKRTYPFILEPVLGVQRSSQKWVGVFRVEGVDHTGRKHLLQETVIPDHVRQHALQTWSSAAVLSMDTRLRRSLAEGADDARASAFVYRLGMFRYRPDGTRELSDEDVAEIEATLDAARRPGA